MNKKTGKAHLNDKQFQKAQAAAIVQRRIMGHSIPDIAREFKMSIDTVTRRIDYAKRHNLLQDAADRVLDELVPLAHLAYIKALQQGNLDAAKDVLFGTGILSKNNKPTIAPPDAAVEMTLAVYREQRKKPYVTPDDSSDVSESPLRELPDLDAEIIGEGVGEEDGDDDLSFERPADWPAPVAVEGDGEGDQEDQD